MRTPDTDNEAISEGSLSPSRVASLIPNSLEWRCIGPYRGGRAVAVAGDPSSPMVFYFGCAGGVWKTNDGGTYWENVSDGFFKTSAVGAIAVSESDPNVIYVGMGESCAAIPRLHWTSRADGMYRSTDAGRTWQNVGLERTRYIAQIRIHPHNPDLVYSAVLGHLEGPDSEKGVFRSDDGGVTWEKVLFRSENAGANDIWMDPTNPRVLYASTWDARRSYWSSYSGGPDTRIYRTTDGGDTWTDLTENPGLPNVSKGRVGVTGTAARPGRVWALFDVAASAEIGDRAGGLYRSEDWGDTWEQVNDDPEMTLRPHYYNHIFGDPQNPEVIYNLNQSFWKSIDGGRTFSTVEAPHYDNHDLWIDPKDSDRIINGNDGGACVTFNGGESWSSIYNQPTGEFYHLTTDAEFPYRVYATQQDNTSISVPSRSSRGAIRWSDCYSVGSSESGHIVVRLDNPNIAYSGAIGSSTGAGAVMLRYDHSTEQVRVVTVWPDITGLTVQESKYRFEWDIPIAVSPHDPNVLYTAANVVFRSVDDGSSWETISPDLTRNDVSDQEESNPDTSIAPFERCAISRFAESPVQPGVFWTGSSDGLVHVSRDGGLGWTDVTPPELPEWTPIYAVDPSPHEPGTVFIAAARYQHGDYSPYLFRSRDYGATWTRIDRGIAEGDYTRVVREDPDRPGLLYAGTEGGVYISFDYGERWNPIQLNLPPVPIHDMVFRDGDLVAATHGRALWILDGVSLLHQLGEVEAGAQMHLFRPPRTYRVLSEPYIYRRQTSGRTKHYQLTLGIPTTYRIAETDHGARSRVPIDAGRNPPDGVVITYFLQNEPEDEVVLTFIDSAGQVIRRLSSRGGAPRVLAEAGMNRFIWDMKHEGARPIEADSQSRRPMYVPTIPPGAYRVRLEVGDQVREEEFEVLLDRRVKVTSDDLRRQNQLLIAIRDKVSESSDAVGTVRSILAQIEQWTARSTGATGRDVVEEAANGLHSEASTIENQLLLGTGGSSARMRGSSYARGLRSRLASLGETVGMADGAPTQQSYGVYHDLSSQIDRQLDALQRVIENDVEAFNSIVRELDLPPILLRESDSAADD